MVGVTVAWLGAVFWPVTMPAFPLFVLTAIVRDAVAIDGPALDWSQELA